MKRRGKTDVELRGFNRSPVAFGFEDTLGLERNKDFLALPGWYRFFAQS